MHRLIYAPSIIFFAALIAFGADHNSAQTFGDGGVSAFYSWDKEVPGKSGKLLRQEPLAANLMLANASQGVRILYTSTDGVGGKDPVTVSGAIYLPNGRAPQGGWPIVAWAHGFTGIADICAPSWVPRSARDADYLNAWLTLGFAIVATDYQGLGTPGPHPRDVVRSLGWSVLDSVRAALGGLPGLANTVVIVGQSQGGLASVSASLLAPQYAPDIHLLGTVSTGLPFREPFSPAPKVRQFDVPLRKGSGLNATSILLRLYDFKTLDAAFDPFDYLADVAKPLFERAGTSCLTDLIGFADEHRLTTDNVFKKTPMGATAKAARYVRYPRPRFSRPIFIGTGLADVNAIPEGQYNVAIAACSEGSTVEMHYYPGKDHSGTVNASLADSVPFVKKLLAGQHIDGNCRDITPPSSTK